MLIIESNQDDRSSYESHYDLQLKEVALLRVSKLKKWIFVPIISILTLGTIHVIALRCSKLQMLLWYKEVELNVNNY